MRDILTAKIKNVILAPLIDVHDPDKKEPNKHSVSINNAEQFPSMSLSIRSSVRKKVYKINSLLTSSRRVHFCKGMTIGFLSYLWTFIAIHSV